MPVIGHCLTISNSEGIKASILSSQDEFTKGIGRRSKIFTDEIDMLKSPMLSNDLLKDGKSSSLITV